ncbi:MAG: hypothetical protein RLP15_11925 [Cryomorphaceae bacterium]
MNALLRNITTLLLALLLLSDGIAQDDSSGKLYLRGKVVNEKKKGIEASIFLYKNALRIDSFTTNRIGRFEFYIPLQDSMAFVVYAKDHVSKTVFVDSRIPEEEKADEFRFPFFIDLYQVQKVPSNFDLERPVGKIIYSGSQFIYDIDFTKEQNERLKEFVRERRELKVRRHEIENQGHE